MILVLLMLLPVMMTAVTSLRNIITSIKIFLSLLIQQNCGVHDILNVMVSQEFSNIPKLNVINAPMSSAPNAINNIPPIAIPSAFSQQINRRIRMILMDKLNFRNGNDLKVMVVNVKSVHVVGIRLRRTEAAIT
jgi:hypothetical protein